MLDFLPNVWICATANLNLWRVCLFLSQIIFNSNSCPFLYGCESTIETDNKYYFFIKKNNNNCLQLRSEFDWLIPGMFMVISKGSMGTF